MNEWGVMLKRNMREKIRDRFTIVCTSDGFTQYITNINLLWSEKEEEKREGGGKNRDYDNNNNG